jgi:ankyrin repeat protein
MVPHTPLNVVTVHGHPSVTDQLIEGRCDVNLQDQHGLSVRYMTAQNGHASVANQLIEAHCNVDLRDKVGYSPLYLSAENGHVSVAK